MIPTNRNTYSLRLRSSGESSSCGSDLADQVTRPFVRAFEPALHFPDEISHTSPARDPQAGPDDTGMTVHERPPVQRLLELQLEAFDGQDAMPGPDKEPMVPVRGENRSRLSRPFRPLESPPRVSGYTWDFKSRSVSARQVVDIRGQGSKARTFLSMRSAGSSHRTMPSSLLMVLAVRGRRLVLHAPGGRRTGRDVRENTGRAARRPCTAQSSESVAVVSSPFKGRRSCAQDVAGVELQGDPLDRDAGLARPRPGWPR